MEYYYNEDLTEEVFGHLCNVALVKCNDRVERRRAGCGGHAMRKRVLIKNFVSHLFRIQKMQEATEEPREEGEVLCQEEEEEDEEEFESETSMSDEDMDAFDGSLDKDYIQCNDHLWIADPEVDGTSSTSSVYNDLLEVRDGAEGRADDLTTSPCLTQTSPTLASAVSSPSSISLYDIYSGVSETATEGDLPQPNDPLASLSSLMEPSSDMSSCDPAFTSLYEGYEINSDDMLSSCFDSQPSSQQPLRGILSESTNINMMESQQGQDEIYISSSTSLTSMTSYASDVKGFACPANVLEDSLEFTDLDAATDEHNTEARKRRSNENYDDFNLSFQKRIKL